MIHVVFNLDDTYAPHCAATIASICENHVGSTSIHFHLLCLNLTEASKRLLILFVKECKYQLSFYDVDADLVTHLPNLTAHHHVTAATYLRLFLPKYLPKEIVKVVYLDCDVIVREDIEKLWNENVEGFALAAIEDVPIFEHNDRLGLQKDASYFNAGVLVVNLEYWRRHQASARFMECLRTEKTKIKFHDQDVLNIVLVEEKKIISPEWNIMDILFAEPRRIPAGYMQQTKGFLKSPAIIHFAGGLKPWDCKLHNPFQKDYFYYLDLTPWRGMRPSFRTMVQKRGYLKAFINRMGIEFFIKNLIK